jgi:hypothetical protein
LMFSLLYQCQALLPDLRNTVGILWEAGTAYPSR